MASPKTETTAPASAAAGTVRPTKKQRDLLVFIEKFIAEHGYSPSYREIMNGMQYNSVATVALHIGNLIRRGHLIKRDRSARSLEVVNLSVAPLSSDTPQASHQAEIDWLCGLIAKRFESHEQLHGSEMQTAPATKDLTYPELRTLIDSLVILGLTAAATEFSGRLQNLQADHA